MAHRIRNGPTAWLGACVFALLSASAADAQTRSTSGSTGTMPPTGAGGTTTGTSGTTMAMPPTGGATTTGVEAGGSALSVIDRMVILMQTINDVVTLTAALGVQDVSELELVMLILVLYEQRVATAEEDAAAGFATPGSLGTLFGGLFGGRM